MSVLEQSATPLTGREVARLSGLTYRQSIDALNALYNLGRIQRHGKKLKSSWQAKRPTDDPPAAQTLEAAIRAFFK